MHLRKLTLACALLVAFSPFFCAGETEEGAKPTIESRSPDRRFAFRYVAESDAQGKAYDLIRRRSGKALARVIESDVDPGPSARFGMTVLWRPDSKAFALTGTLWKRGSYVEVYLRHGAGFHMAKLPDLLAEIPDKVMKGKAYPHISELNSQSAMRWRKDGSLVVEIENVQDGNDGSITSNRTVILSFAPSGQTKVLKSIIKFQTEAP